MSQEPATPDEIARAMKTLAARGGRAKAGRMSAADRKAMSRRMHEAKAAKRGV